jgi:RNA ligase (TIGR02306 family)
MSTLIVKVRTVDAIEVHPSADKLEICVCGGWRIVSRKGDFSIGQKCVYFPIDSVLPPTLANGPGDNPPGRLNIAKYCVPINKAKEGYRVRAARLRGIPSYGVIITIDPSKGDLDWAVDTDVAEHFGITKWDPPPLSDDGDAMRDHPLFPKYTDIQHLGNFHLALTEGEEVFITEKIHGKNARCGQCNGFQGVGHRYIQRNSG